jgi:hypothetical protein
VSAPGFGSFVVEEDIDRFYDAFADSLFRTGTPSSHVNVKVRPDRVPRAADPSARRQLCCV